MTINDRAKCQMTSSD